jgi:hypothetical protein
VAIGGSPARSSRRHPAAASARRGGRRSRLHQRHADTLRPDARELGGAVADRRASPCTRTSRPATRRSRCARRRAGCESPAAIRLWWRDRRRIRRRRSGPRLGIAAAVRVEPLAQRAADVGGGIRAWRRPPGVWPAADDAARTPSTIHAAGPPPAAGGGHAQPSARWYMRSNLALRDGVGIAAVFLVEHQIVARLVVRRTLPWSSRPRRRRRARPRSAWS